MDLCSDLIRSWQGSDDDIALRAGDETCSWSRLKQRIMAFAALFEARGIKKGDRLAVILEKGLDAVACVFAAIASRVTYIPLDPTAPADRLAYIVEQADPHHAIVGPGLEAVAGRVPVVRLEEVDAAPALQGWKPASGSDSDIVYIIFTSGSEGRPKGVMIDVGALKNFTAWVGEYFARLHGKVIMNIASFSFDQSVLDLVMFAALRCPLVFLKDAKNPLAMLAAIERYGVQSISTVPNSFAFLLDGGSIAGRFDLSRLETLILGGSAFHVALRDKLAATLPHVDLYNLYGPTEATVYCSACAVSKTDAYASDPLPLGDPLPQMQMFLIDPEGRVVEGEGQGELVIVGPQVMAGYFRDEDRTRAAMTLPFPVAARAYRSGDAVRRTAEGEYYFIARRDEQIKTAGYRVSLLEIEGVLISHESVTEAAVVACPDPRTEFQIVAFVVASAGAALDEYLRSKLPAYMVPHRIVPADILPRNASGKTDKVALKARALDLLAPAKNG